MKNKISIKLVFCTFMASIMIGLYSFSNEKYMITADIKGLGNDTVFVEYYLLSYETEKNVMRDTIVANNNRLQYNLPVNGSTIVTMYPKN